MRDASAEYAQIASQKLAAAGHPLSTRRAVQLTRNIVAVAATLTGDLEDAFFTALRHSVPDEAWGAPVPRVLLLTVHRTAWQLVKLDGNDEMKALLTEPDPVRRIALAVASPSSAITRGEAGQVLADAWSSLPRLDRLATAAVLAERFSLIQGLPTACIELVAGECARLGRQGTEQITVRNGGADWRRTLLGSDLARLSLTSERGKALTNAAVVLMQEGEPFELTALETAYDHATDVFKAAGA